MANSITELFRKKIVGVDMFDNPLKVIDSKRGIYIDTPLEKVFNNLSYNMPKNEIKEFISEQKYWGNFEFISKTLTYINKTSGKSLLSKTSLFLSIPYDFRVSKYTEIILRMIEEATIQAGYNEIHIIDNYMCAAIGTGVPVAELTKYIFIYSNSWCTYIGIIFAGNHSNVKIIDKSYDEITKEEINETVNIVIKTLSNNLPFDTTKVKISSQELKKIEQRWRGNVSKKIYLAVPKNKRYDFGYLLENFELTYIDDYDSCMMNGLNSIMKTGIFYNEHGTKVKV